MTEKINIAEILKDYPPGMELDCLMYEDVYFDYVDEFNNIHCYIQQEFNKTSVIFNQDGTPNSHTKSKCVIYPKGKTTWNEFVPPCKFKDGDIYYIKDVFGLEFVSIIKKCENNKLYTYVDIGISTKSFYCDESEGLCYCKDIIEHRLATEEEKKKLFDAIKANGYHWNADTKTLEKLVIKPNFQVGDCVRHHKYGIGDITQIIWIDNEIVYETHFANFTTYCKSNELRKYELSPNKFDVTTLQPFDKVLVRGFGGVWGINIFGFYDGNNKECPFYCIGQTATGWNQCVPYWKNEHLLGTTDDCDDFYKTWE